MLQSDFMTYLAAKGVQLDPTILSNSNTPVVNTIEIRNTGVILKVLPHVNSNGTIELEVDQEVSARRRAALDLLGERLLDANRTIGRPDKITVIFGRKVTKHYRGKLQPRSRA
jgi:hypothetical protein